MERSYLRCLLLALLLVCFGYQAQAQIITPWSKVDTVTTGPFDDLHPVISHDGLFNAVSMDPINVVFERHTSTESQIAMKRYDPAKSSWDTAITIISSVPVPQQQISPDLAETHYSSGDGPHIMRVATWLRNESNVWRIYYSTLIDSQSVWSSPSLLVADSIDNTAVHVRPFPDSIFVFTWIRANLIRGLDWSPSGVVLRRDTMATGVSGKLEYDVQTSGGYLTLVWTSGDTSNPTVETNHYFSYDPSPLAVPETLLTGIPVGNPRWLYYSLGNYALVESHATDSGDILYVDKYYGPGYGSLTGDSTAVNRNASAVAFPRVITKPYLSSASSQLPPLDACVYEKYRGADSMLVFLGVGWGSSDTMRSPGHNRDGVVGSRGITTYPQWNAKIPVVWESNRTGRAHIYARWLSEVLGDVSKGPVYPVSSQLFQNYPNPFNPTTTIQYALPHRSRVTLTVFNTLGQQVATLVNGEVEAGYHEAQFDGSGLASGVYFYRLQAGSFVETKKLLLVR